MSMSPRTLAALRDFGRELRGEVVKRPEVPPLIEVPLFMRLDFTYCRVWLYRGCLFLPARLFGKTFSVQENDPMVSQLLEICRRHSLKKPTGRTDIGIERDTPWTVEDVIACLQALLFHRENANCIKKRFTLRLVQRDPTEMAITEE
jgi:hypothetical protein